MVIEIKHQRCGVNRRADYFAALRLGRSRSIPGALPLATLQPHLWCYRITSNSLDSPDYAAAGKTSFLLSSPALINVTMIPTGRISTIAIAKNNNGFSNSFCINSISAFALSISV